MARLPILTYHGVNVGGNAYATNDHVALAADLKTVDRLGWRIVPLPAAVERWVAGDPAWTEGRTLAITFDDGTDFDWRDLPHPVHGVQRSLFNTLADFRQAHARPRQAHATTFVVVSRETREHIDRVGLAARGWWSDDWWAEAAASGHAAIASHSWDHNHEALSAGHFPHIARGVFTSIDTREAADYQIEQAALYLRRRAPNPAARLFAYPYGPHSEYLVREYFPSRARALQIDACMGDDARPWNASSNRWELPRYVHGRDWHVPEDLAKLLRDAA